MVCGILDCMDLTGVLPLLFVAVAKATVLGLFVITPLAETIRLMDIPSDRKKYCDPTPTVGGLVFHIAIPSSVGLLDLDAKII